MAYRGPQVLPQGGLETPQAEGEAGAGVEGNSEGSSLEPCAAQPGAMELDKATLEQKPRGGGEGRHGSSAERPRAICRAPEAEEDHPRAHPDDVGLTLGVLFGKVFSQTIVCRFRALPLSLKNTGKARPPLQKGVQEADHENLQETGGADLRAGLKEKAIRDGEPSGGNLESLFPQLPKPTLQQVSQMAQRLGLEKAVL